MKIFVFWGSIVSIVVLVLAFIAIQLVPYGKDHSNPPVIQEPDWNSPEARQLAVRACYDCHSNETTWPWYASVAPVSWLVQRDVNEGRSKLNFSQWGSQRNEIREAGETVHEGEMPPWFYVIMHPGAKLSNDEKTALAEALQSMAGSERRRRG